MTALDLALNRLPTPRAYAAAAAARALPAWWSAQAVLLAACAVAVLAGSSLVLRTARASSAKPVAVAVQADAKPARVPHRWRWNVLQLLCDILEQLDADDDEHQPPRALALPEKSPLSAPSSPHAASPPPPAGARQVQWQLDGSSYRLPAATPLIGPPPKRAGPGHRRAASLNGGAGQFGGVPLSSPPAPRTAFSPPPAPMRHAFQRQMEARPPLCAAKVILSRQYVRKPYRPPPVPGQPRMTPCSKLASAAIADAADADAL